MPELDEIKTMVEAMGKAQIELKDSISTQLKEAKAGNNDPLLVKRIDEMAKEIADNAFDKDKSEREAKSASDRMSKIEADFKSAGGKGNGQEGAPVQTEYSKAMNTFIRKGDGNFSDAEQKALSVGHDPDGGYLVTPEQSAQIIKSIFETSPMRSVAMIETIGSDSLDIPEDINDIAGGWGGELSTRAETDTPEIGKRKIEVHELNAMPKATQKILDDASINIEAWLAGKQSGKFSRLENTAFVTGTGVGQPRGCMTYDGGTTNPGQIERVTTAVNDVLDDVDLVSALYKLKGDYRMNATWAFNRNTLAVIAKIQDGQGRFVFQPGLQIGAPNSLLGRPMIEFNDMADAADGTLPVLIADFKQFYTVVDRQGVTMLRDPYTQKGFVLFYTTKRTGGDVTNFEAGKIIEIQ